MIPRLYRGNKKSNVLSVLTFNDASLWGADTFVAVVLALFITTNFDNGTAIEVGFAFAIYRVMRAVAAIPLGRYFDEHRGHYDEYLGLVLAGLLVGGSYFGMFFATELWMIYLGMGLVGLGHAIDILSWQILFYSNVPERSRGSVLGVYQTFMQIIYALSTVIAGFVGERYGFEWVLFLAGVLAIVSSIIMLIISRRERESI